MLMVVRTDDTFIFGQNGLQGDELMSTVRQFLDGSDYRIVASQQTAATTQVTCLAAVPRRGSYNKIASEVLNFAFSYKTEILGPLVILSDEDSKSFWGVHDGV